MPFVVKIPPEFQGLLRLGTCSWKYDSWKGLIYEAGKHYRPDDYLRDYAKVLDTVEIDQWFWSLFAGQARLPQARAVSAYEKSVPESFVFTVKAPNALTLTHFYAKQPPSAASLAGKPNPYFLDAGLLHRFLELLSPLGRKLGPIMFQFEYLNKQKMPSKEAFFERFGAFIRRAPQGISIRRRTSQPELLLAAFFHVPEGIRPWFCLPGRILHAADRKGL